MVLLSIILRNFVRKLLSKKYHWIKLPKLDTKANTDLLVDGKFDHSITRLENTDGVRTNAKYGFRFVAFPFKHFASIYLDRPVDEITTNELKQFSDSLSFSSVSDQSNADAYKAIFNTFIEQYNKRRQKVGLRDISVRILDEEIFHHNHTSKTATWVFSNTLSYAIRGIGAYCIRHNIARGKLSSDAVKRSFSFTLHASFIRASLAQNTVVIIEAFFHRNNIAHLREAYGPGLPVKLADDFIAIQNKVKSLRSAKETEEIMVQVLEFTLNYPYASLLDEMDSLDFLAFNNKYYGGPINRLQKILEVLTLASIEHLNNKEICALIEGEITLAMAFEQQVFPTTMYLYQKKFFSDEAISEILLHLGTSALAPFMLSNFFSMKNNRVQTYFQPPYPAFYVNDMNGNSLILDSSIVSIDNPKHLSKAQVSFEAFIVNDEKKKSKFRDLTAFTLFVKIITKVLYQRQSLENLFQDYSFTYAWQPKFSPYTKLLEQGFITTAYNLVKEIDYLMPNNLFVHGAEIIDDTFLVKSHEQVKRYFAYLDSLQLSEQEIVFQYCDLHYCHGM